MATNVDIYLRSHTVEQLQELREKLQRMKEDPDAPNMPVNVVAKKYGVSRYWVHVLFHPEKINPHRRGDWDTRYSG